MGVTEGWGASGLKHSKRWSSGGPTELKGGNSKDAGETQ